MKRGKKMNKKFVLGLGTVLFGTTMLAGCGSNKVDDQYLSKNDSIWRVKGSDIYMWFDDDGIVHLKDDVLGGRKGSVEGNYIVTETDNNYKLTMAYGDSGKMEFEIPKDDVKANEFQSRMSGEKNTFYREDKDYLTKENDKKLKSEKENAKKLIDKAGIVFTGTEGNGTIKITNKDAKVGDLTAESIKAKNNGKLKDGEKAKIVVYATDGETVAYETELKVENLMPTDPKKIKNLKSVEDKVKNWLATESSSNNNSSDENTDTHQEQTKYKWTYYYNTKRGTIACIGEESSRSRERPDKDDDWDEWSDWETSYKAYETNKLVMTKDGNVNEKEISLNRNDSTFKQPELLLGGEESLKSPKDILESLLSDTAQIDRLDDFIEIK